MALSTVWSTLSCATVVAVLAFLACAIRRQFFHRLSAFPGPRLAAITTLYKIYYEVFREGELLQHLIELHAIYGHVVRIAPNELHFNDYAAHSAIYAVGSPFTKDKDFYGSFGADGSAFGAIQPHDSRMRRNLLSPLFSRRAILKFECVIQEKVERLISQLVAHHRHKPANMVLAFRCTTMDIITSYCFAKCENSLDSEEFHHQFLVANRSAIPAIWLMKFLPFLIPVLCFLPRCFANHLPISPILAFIELNAIISEQIDRILDDEDLLEITGNPTIYHHLLNASKGNFRRSRRDLIEEAFSLLQAGTEGPGNACTVGTFYILNDPVIHKKLFEELRDAWPEKDTTMGYGALQKLPYLTAVIKESLRMSHGIVTPLPRIVGPTSALISGHKVPAGAVVGVSVVCLNNDEMVFMNPHAFSPERWMQPHSRDLDKHLVPFSRGPRMCMGINLAWCELYLIFGNIFRRLDMDIHDTSVEDFRIFKDFFTPVHEGRNLHIYAKNRES
ncbi:hypothetical protein D9615_000247 [Tricholomella constricta]|uniref:Cytochrome P450 n=1 Tax=Tricholomella constricta TaxID=117010 RepID=A0A8H5MBS3_9AGAR|nr:hypothetical protein D9615_000247 [Tricholomella constricta]